MLASLGGRAFELAGPSLRRLAGARVDQIEGIAFEDRARDRHRLECLLRRMQPPERFERSVIQRLHPERDAIDAGQAKTVKAPCFDAGRIGF